MLTYFFIAVELAMIMDRLYGGVCYAGIDTDPELKYPKGAGRVAFSNQQSYIAAISARFVQLQHGEIDKRVSQQPYTTFVNSIRYISMLPSRSRSSPTCWTINCATNAKGRGAGASLRHSSAPTSHAYR